MAVPDTPPTGGPPPPPERPGETQLFSPGVNNVQFVYVMLLVGIAFGITAIVAAVFAHVNSGRSVAWLNTHYSYQIATFWLGVGYSLVAFLLMFILIGYLLLPLIAVWVIVRCVKGLSRVNRSEPIDNPWTLLW